MILVVTMMISALPTFAYAQTAAGRPVADFDGDGVTDIAVFRPSEGAFSIVVELPANTAPVLGAAADSPTPPP